MVTIMVTFGNECFRSWGKHGDMNAYDAGAEKQLD